MLFRSVPELVEDGTTGWLVPPGQVAGLADAVSEAMADPERTRAMGLRGREKMAPLTWDRTAADVIRALEGCRAARSR